MNIAKETSDASTLLRQIASLLGATGVTLGAMGSHALKDKLVQRNMLASWNTAILYQLFHATAVLGISALCASEPQKSNSLLRAGQVMAAGNFLFSGSIYMLCFGIGPKYITGPTTPIGGLFMIGGWVMLGLSS
jgi:uncharacterized membrane protein YgdD (TMEM256/DUF423 family)